jgi:phenylacetate-coenzyme A ligase PaaK-like adenylate-forming protein
MSVFQYQYQNNPIYRQFAEAMRITPDKVHHITEIPFLPVSFFKTHRVVSGNNEPQAVFESSGTTGVVPGRHYITDLEIYEVSLLKTFQKFYGEARDYAVLAVLPSYLERSNSSLVHMTKILMERSGHAANGFYLDDFDALYKQLKQLESKGQKTLLIGVTFALLDLAEQFPMKLGHTIVMETGGMKGRGKELTRQEVHGFLKKQWQLPQVHSEYSMTELLSQAYAVQDGIFKTADTMRMLVRDIHDPLEIRRYGTGCLNIIDLANFNSCSFIATEDIGTIHSDGSFEVLGRMDFAALRGCNLMAV